MKQKRLPIDEWLAEEVRDLARRRHLTVPAYLRRAVLRQVREDLEGPLRLPPAVQGYLEEKQMPGS